MLLDGVVDVCVRDGLGVEEGYHAAICCVRISMWIGRMGVCVGNTEGCELDADEVCEVGFFAGLEFEGVEGHCDLMAKV